MSWNGRKFCQFSEKYFLEIYSLQRSKENFLVQESTWCKLVSTKAIHCLNVTKVTVWNCRTAHTAFWWGNVLYSVILITLWAQFSVQWIHRKQRDCKRSIKTSQLLGAVFNKIVSAFSGQWGWGVSVLPWQGTGQAGQWEQGQEGLGATLCIHTYVYINTCMWETQLLFWETRKEGI